MAKSAVVQQLDGALAAALPPVLDEESEHRAQLLATQRILTANLCELDDHELRIRRNGEAGPGGDGLRLLTDDVGIDSLARRRDHQALERALLVWSAEMRPLSPEGITDRALDRRIDDHGVLRRT